MPAVYVRLRLDLGWRDLSAAAAAVLGAGRRSVRQVRVEAIGAASTREGGVLACLSVRSALDLFLAAVRLPAGSEVLMTALNVPDMARIVSSHGLVPVPVDLDPVNLGPSREALARAATPRTAAILVAHLFGGRAPLDAAAEAARQNGWFLLEDCAQCFSDPASLGDPRSDAAFFSFGPIKTATALGGALARVRNDSVLARMRAIQAGYPVQRRAGYGLRVLRFALLLLLSRPLLYRAFAAFVGALGRDLDDVVHGSVRAFPRGDLLAQIRRQPSTPLLAFLERRLRRIDGERARKRAALGRELAVRVPPPLRVPGGRASAHTHWVFPVSARHPTRLVSRLRAAGFDATSRATLDVIPAPPNRPDLDPVETRRLREAIVYLPVYPELPEAAREHLLTVLAGCVESGNA